MLRELSNPLWIAEYARTHGLRDEEVELLSAAASHSEQWTWSAAPRFIPSARINIPNPDWKN